MNHCSFLGNLTRDPELKHIENGTAVASIGLAVNRKYKKKGSDELQEEVSFFDLEAWGKMAEVIHQYCHKGDQILIADAEAIQDRWETDDQKRSKVKFRINKFEFVNGGKKNKNGDGDNSKPASNKTPQKSESPPTEIDDEIPF